MKTITERIQETIEAEKTKNSLDKKFIEFEQLLEQLDKLGIIKKSEYSLPLVDTIGKTLSSKINKHLGM